MSHFAHLDPFSIVDQVIVAEADFVATLPDSQNYIQCSYNTRGGLHYSPITNAPDGGLPLRGNYPGLGDFYDRALDAFVKPAPDNPNSATLNPINFTWESFWVNLNNGVSWCAIPRNASTAISIPLAQKYCNAPAGLQNYEYEYLLPWSAAPTGVPHAVIRDPLDRFCSAFAHGFPITKNLNVDDFIAWMIAQDPAGLEEHFRPQSLIFGSVPNVTLHNIAQDLSPLASVLGVDSIPVANDAAESSKPVLTADQSAKLSAYYAADIAIYGQVKSSP
jgi:hypothetical protein